MQLRHYLEKITRKEELQQSNLGIVRIILLGYRSDPERGNISKMYKMLQEVEGNDAAYIKKKWEKESNIVMQMEMWEKILFTTVEKYICSVLERIWVEEYS